SSVRRTVNSPMRKRWNHGPRTLPGCDISKLLDEMLELLTQVVELLRCGFHLLRAGDCLRASLLDVFHGRRDLIHSDKLLLARGRDLRRSQRCAGDALRERADRFAGGGRLPD